jgi:multidrug resistance protein MdtO
LLIVVFVAGLVSAWVSAGSPRISYVGYQMAFAFFLCVIQGPSPAFDLTIARDRVIGILFGNVVAYLVFTNIWPVTVTRLIDPGLVSLLRRLVDLTNATSRARRDGLAADATEAMVAVSQDVALAAYESRGVGSPRFRLATRACVLEKIRALIGPLLLLSNEQSPATRTVAHRLDALANGLSGGARSAQIPVPPNQTSLANNVDGYLRESRTVDGIVMTDLDFLEAAFARRNGELEAHAPV